MDDPALVICGLLLQNVFIAATLINKFLSE